MVASDSDLSVPDFSRALAYRFLRRLRRVLVAVAVVYLGLILMLMLIERSMVYPAPPRAAGEWNPSWLGHEEVDFRSADGTRLHGWFLEHPSPHATMLFCHGNGEHVAYLAEEMRLFRERFGVSVMVFDYRGYGKSEGQPNQPGVLADGAAALDWLCKRTGQSPDRIVLMGRSLGGAVAVHLASTRGARLLVIDCTFSSMVDVAAMHMRWLPVRLVMRNRYPAARWIAEYSGPLFQTHGGADEVVPVEMGRRLFDACPSADKRWLVDPQMRHNTPWPARFYDELADSIARH
jgi:fermentation-respiration switch protein FrsA (DUF1100 family)